MRAHHSLLAALLAVGVLATPLKRHACDEENASIEPDAVKSNDALITPTPYLPDDTKMPGSAKSTFTITVTETVTADTPETTPSGSIVTVTSTVSSTTTTQITTTITGTDSSAPTDSSSSTDAPTGKPSAVPSDPPKSPTDKTPGEAPTDDATDPDVIDPAVYQYRVVKHHNFHRANHSAPDMEWDDGLAATALKIAKTCVFEHNMDMDGGHYGQNIAAGAPPRNISAIISEGFYNGEYNAFEPHFGEKTPSTIGDYEKFKNYGHLSQLIWAGSTRVGCATHLCDKLGKVSDMVRPFYTVCNYKATGNVQGSFDENVKSPLKQETVHWDKLMSDDERDMMMGKKK